MFALSFMTACDSGFDTTERGIEVSVAGGAERVRLEVVTDDIIRVSASVDESFDRDASLIIVPQTVKTEFTAKDADSVVVLSTKTLDVTVNKNSGEVVFADKSGKVILSEEQRVIHIVRYGSQQMMKHFMVLVNIRQMSLTTRARMKSCFNTILRSLYHLLYQIRIMVFYGIIIR